MLRYSISDRHLFAGKKQISDPDNLSCSEAPFPDLLAQAHRLARAGVDFFQLREPDLPARDLAHLAQEILAIFREIAAPTRLLLPTRADIAVAVRAHGVHLPSTPGELTPDQIRELFRLSGLPIPTVSLSCHTLADIRRAHTLAPDLVLFGPVFEKRVCGQLIQPGTGLPLLREACRLAAPTPVLALGGLSPENTPACLEAGAAGAAAIRLFALPRVTQ